MHIPALIPLRQRSLKLLNLTGAQVRYVSLNSAINRGIRKTKPRQDYGRDRYAGLGDKERPMRGTWKDNEKPTGNFEYGKKNNYGDQFPRRDRYEKSGDREPVRSRWTGAERSPRGQERGTRGGYQRDTFNSEWNKTEKYPRAIGSDRSDGFQRRTSRGDRFGDQAPAKPEWNKTERSPRTRERSSRDEYRDRRPGGDRFRDREPARSDWDKSDRFPRKREWQSRDDYEPRTPKWDRSERQADPEARSGWNDGDMIPRNKGHVSRRDSPRHMSREEKMASRKTPPAQTALTRRAVVPPTAIPYTTAASEFLYGSSVVRSALEACRRKLYKLYVYEGENRQAAAEDMSLRKLALRAGVEVVGVGNHWLGTLDKMSKGRPHNGYILEASALPGMPVTGLHPVSRPAANFAIKLSPQTQEDEMVNGTDEHIPYGNGESKRFPFILMLDGILDPGNLGAVLRAAHFLGVDAIAVSSRNSAPITPVVLKSSAGAAEYIPLLKIATTSTFLTESAESGWKLYAAVAPPSTDSSSRSLRDMVERRVPYLTHASITSNNSPLTQHPTILMLGSEGEGLSQHLLRRADYHVGIARRLSSSVDSVDSLNVSVAGALLCERFLESAMPVGEPSERVF